MKRMAMANPREKFNNRLRIAKAKFQVTSLTNGPRNAGLMKKFLKLSNRIDSMKPGRSSTPADDVKVPRRFL